MQQQIEASYKQLIKAGKNPEFLSQAVIELMEKPEIIKDYEGDTTKALKALTKTVAQRIKWQKRQEIQRFVLFEAEKTDEKGNAVKLEIADNSAVYDIERIEMIKHVISLLSKDETKQKIFCLYYIEKQTVREIAEVLNLSKSDVDRKLKSVANTIDKANIRRLYADIYISATERPAGLDKCHCKQQHDKTPSHNGEQPTIAQHKRQAKKATAKAKARKALYESGLQAINDGKPSKMVCHKKVDGKEREATIMDNWDNWDKRRTNIFRITDEQENEVGLVALGTYQSEPTNKRSFPKHDHMPIATAIA
jgi:RNA polymerase sigma factor (sigma-70 family)